MLNQNNYVISVSRSEVSKLLIACTKIICDARTEMESLECPEYRRTHVLPESIKMWQNLHDKIKKQLEILDAFNAD